MNQVNWKYILIVLILTIIIGSGIFYWSNQYEVSYTEIAPTKTQEEDFSDWKTYQNEKYGFEFKYPRDWSKSDYKLELNKTNYLIGPDIGLHGIGGNQIDFYISLNNQTLTEWINKNIGFEGSDEKIIIGGVEGIKRTGKDQITSEIAIGIIFQNDNKVFSFSSVGEKNNNILNQILSTFKFIE